jgi:hypothetical protein
MSSLRSSLLIRLPPSERASLEVRSGATWKASLAQRGSSPCLSCTTSWRSWSRAAHDPFARASIEAVTCEMLDLRLEIGRLEAGVPDASPL